MLGKGCIRFWATLVSMATESSRRVIRGAFGKFLAWPIISVTESQTLSCLVSF